MKSKKTAKHLLILGTASHVGKSAVVTAICNILSKDYKVAPFKAQNMSLNSWITKDGKEIGIAQAIQAKAAGIEPTVDMNPVLLKPKSDRMSQVIILGEPYADKTAGDYYESIEMMYDILRGSLERLGEEYDIIVMEGAGGAAEINLYERDIVNIGTARLTDAPIILVGDIERGGVFASLYGTIKLLPADVRANVRGFIINKFRGDPAILESGLREIEERTGIPVLGVLPYFDIKIPSEDSLSIEDKSKSKPRSKSNYKSGSESENLSAICNGSDDVEIAVIRFPRISNFTDFEPLENMARVRYVELGDELGEPDAIILPGTKNTISDLSDLKKSGMDTCIKELYGKVPIIGICGGYQMLGKTIIDSGVEGGRVAKFEGLGLLDVATTFDAYEKKTVQVTKTVTGSGAILESIKGETISGYEIHMGSTESCTPVFGDDGCIDESGLVIGTYLHGLFENDNVRRALISNIYERKGIEYKPKAVYSEFDAYEELADVVRKNVDMKRVFEIIGID